MITGTQLRSGIGDGIGVGVGIAIVGCTLERGVDNPDALIARYVLTREWADALVRAGSGPVAVVQRFVRDVVERRGAVEYHFVADRPLARWSWACRVARTLRALDAAVVHVDGLVFPATVGQLRLALPKGTAIVVQDHGGVHDGSPGFHRRGWRTLHRLGLRAADAFLFTAREQAAPWQRAGIIGPSQTIHEVLECSSELDATDARKGDALPGRPALLWVGRLDANKDPLTVLEGFEQVATALPEAALTLVFGDEPLLAEVRAKIAGSSVLRPRVHLRGRMDRGELPALYAAADLFVLGSHHEGSGVALIESLAFGVTPVVTDIPSFRAITGNGRIGALFSPGHSEDFARAVVRVSALDLAAQRGDVRAYFEDNLSWSAIGRHALLSYQAIAEARARRVR